MYNISEINNLYNDLNLKYTSDVDEIKKAYKKLALKYHPDKNKSSSEKFIKIKNSYEIIINEKLYLYNISSTQETNNKFINNIDKHINNIYCSINKFLDFNYEFNLLNIQIEIEFTLKEYYNNISKIIKYKRITKNIFIEKIYPLDLIQIYENEGEEIIFNDTKYNGNFIIIIKIIDKVYNGINYNILNNDLYIKIDINDNNIFIKYLNDITYNFDINKLLLNKTEFGNLYKINNLGLPYYCTNKIVINLVEDCPIKRGNLFILV